MHPLTSFPPDHTSIIVIDTISPLFATAFPRVIENFDNNQTPAKKHEAAQWAAGRRYAVMGDFVSRLGKLATIRNIAILLISQTTTKVRGEKAAILRPSITTKSWDEGISTRIVLFRDWISRDCGASQKERPKAVRFAAVVKLGGALYDGMATATPFTIEKVTSPSPMHMCRLLITTDRSSRSRRRTEYRPANRFTDNSRSDTQA